MNTQERYRRQLDILPPDRLAKLNVTIIGCGAVGSFTCLTLAKMGVTDITVYDGDSVEEHNLPNQWYRPDHVGWNKTDALYDVIYDFTELELKAHARHYTREPLTGIVICCVDSMDARLKIWREVKKYARTTSSSPQPGPNSGHANSGASSEPALLQASSPPRLSSRPPGLQASTPLLYLDARMGAEVGKILVVHPSLPSSVRRYEQDLYPSSEAFHAPCTAKATIYCAAGLAAFIGAIVAGHANGRMVEGVVVDWRTSTLITGNADG